MNTIIATAVGAFAALAVLIGGVNVATSDPKPVSNKKLYSYSDQ